MPSAGGTRLVGVGREDDAEVKESVRVVRRAGRVADVAMKRCFEMSSMVCNI